MSDTGAVTDPNINRAEHDPNANAKRVITTGWTGSNTLKLPVPFVPYSYDYVALVSGTTTDTYTFYQGGSGGTLVTTVTITYSDSTKATISNIART